MALKITRLLLLALLAASLSACGLKAPPRPASEVAPAAIKDIKAEQVGGKVRVTFPIPRRDKASQRIVKVRLYYGYQPISGKDSCPPCPPVLHKRHVFDLSRMPGLQNGGNFTYMDENAPNDAVASYQAVLIDASGYSSKRSVYARVPKVTPTSAPPAFKAVAGDKVVQLFWGDSKTLVNGRPVPNLVGYRIYRRDDDHGEKMLNLAPFKGNKLADKTVQNGVAYSYRVQAVQKTLVGNAPGEFSPWQSAMPKDHTVPDAPTDLRAISQGAAVFLRFAPSIKQDVKGYFVQRSQKKEGPFVSQNLEPLTLNVYEDAKVKKGVTYYYRVLAIDDAGNMSKPSETIQIKHGGQ